MSVQLITRPTDSINPPADAGLFVIFEIAGGCKCCARSPRETVLPEGWGSRSGMSLRELLAFPHGVDRYQVAVLAWELSADLTRERVAEIRASVA